MNSYPGQKIQLPMSPPLHRVRQIVQMSNWRVALTQAGIGLAWLVLTVAGAAPDSSSFNPFWVDPPDFPFNWHSLHFSTKEAST